MSIARGDQRYVRLHTNFKHHRAAVCNVLQCEPERENIQAALMNWDGEAFETAAYAGGAVVSLMRSHDEWMATPHAQALGAVPVLTIEKIGEAPPKPWIKEPWTKEPWTKGARPLSGVRVLDLSRVIAAPVAGRTLAAHGADVLLVYGPNLPAIPWLTIDTGRGKLSALHRAEERGGPRADARAGS